MAIVGVTYNLNNFQTTDSASAQILTRDILFESIPNKSFSLSQDSIRDGFSVVDSLYTQKMITLRGWLISDTPANFRTHLDTVKGYIRPNEKNLDIETYGGSGEYRRYVCSCENFSVESEHWMTTQFPYEAIFLCQPEGTATSTTSVDLNSGGAISSSPYNEQVSITGTYKAKPTITITINSETDMTVFKWDNTTVGDWIQVATAFSAADVLVINCEDETVKLNGSSIDFTGVFPHFEPGNNNLTLTVTATAFNMDVSFAYYPTYL